MSHEVVSHAVATRWKRYGKDRLYVNGPDGLKIGWWDLVSDEAHPESPGQADLLADAVRVWRSGRPSTTSTAVAGASSRERVVESPAAPPPPPVAPRLRIETPWEDLAVRRPGETVREQAERLQREAPVRTLLARALGVHTDERAWRVGAEGEEKVAARLARLTKKDPRWHVLHGVPVGKRGSDIDHVVVGPGGVFTLNAKHHPGAKVKVSGDTVYVDGHRTPYVRNSRFESQRAARLLSAAVGVPVPVVGVIVPVRADDVEVRRQPDGVYVVPRMQIARWLSQRPVTMDDAAVGVVFDAARRSTTWSE